MTAVTANGITIEYETHGPDDGEPVLLVMGLGAQLVVWPMAFVEALTNAGYRVVRFDNRDIGRSSRIPSPPPGVRSLAKAFAAPRRVKAPYSLGDMADDAAGLLDQLEIRRAHVIGASMGGMIAQELAITHGDRVASLTSIMSNTGRRGKGAITPGLLPALARSRASSERSVDDAVAIGRLIGGPHFDEAASRALNEVVLEREGDPTEAAAGLARQTLAVATTRDRTADLGRLTIPTLVVHGLVDRLVRPSGGIATARAVPGSRLLMFPDMAHDVPDVRVPEITGAIIENFRRNPIDAEVPAAG